MARNVVTRAGEMDLVAEEGQTLCFVEVKARSSIAYGEAIGFVTPIKQRGLARASALYLAREGIGEREVRFDVLGLERRNGRWSQVLLRNAFASDKAFLV